MTTNFNLTRNPFGRLVLTTAEGEVHESVAPVRAFPVQAPDDGIALVSTDGKEVGWIDRIEDLPAAVEQLVREELTGREFMPEIARINSVTSFATPCTWSVATDRGDTEFVLRGEEDIRRLTVDTLLISDIHGIHYLIRDVRELDKHSKKILDRFL
ncbi:DUF1854 domain-containing protein [Duganella sp. BJB488]|uniref:cyanophycin metabolism-associated DUF1854 family protein n=1 Tax=unclassified Duganella TaxID=2636909 RepID=UPI000E350EEA|nr:MULTISPECIES: DUF1854 domain-containing protein [unclassified Duganella]RFP09054.1 DUF1854 domain-containing protein [Duganella sp. BJB489]RFP11845.1 DUF1854 domain-containing protein [Duganella sp. BJB488]RFP29027.1 DUF1854 domain-containing protein [Duganella sp. BJB480]